MFSSHFWQLFLAALSGSPFSQLFLAAISSTYSWQLFLAAISGSYFWQLFLAAISSSYFWQLFLAAISAISRSQISQPFLPAIFGSCSRQLFQLFQPFQPFLSAISGSYFWQLFLAAIPSSYPRYYMTFLYQANIYSGIRRAFLWPPDPSTHREWSSERLRELLKRETTAGLRGQALNLPAYRDIAIGISRRFMRPSSIFPNNAHNDERASSQDDPDSEAGLGAEQWMGHIADLQAAHSSHVAGMIYGRGIMEQPGTTAHRREMFRLSSTDWHKFLGFVSSDDGGAESALRQAKRSPWEIEAEQGRTERRWQLQQARMEPQLQQLLGTESAQFRGVQAAAIQAIQQGQSPVIAVMPTGSGKSMLFMLPA
jgi:hypothetical protein